MIILGTNSIKDTGFNVANSARFDGTTAYLNRTPGSASNRKTFTFSTWIKRSGISGVSTHQDIFSSDAGDDESYIHFVSDNLKIYSTLPAGTAAAGDPACVLITNQVFRDFSAWMHIVVAVDTTQGTAANRAKLYINGTQVTSFSTETYPDQNYLFATNAAVPHMIGRRPAGSKFLPGYLAETVLVDGSQLAPTSFGEFDEDSGIWKPIDVSGLTFGTNGFYLDYEDSGDLGDDESGNGNDFTENNLAAVDQSIDTCTNNFSTLNPLISSNASFLEGNLRCNFASSGEYGSDSSIGITSGKWYAEFKFTAGANHYLILGVNDQNGQNERSRSDGSAGKGGATGTIGYRCSDGKYRVNNSHTSYGGSGGDGNIFSIAIDKDNGKVYFAVDGTYGNSGNPATNSNGIDVSSVLTGDTWFFNVGNDTGASETQVEANFGSPSYSESGGETDGAGFGNFAHAVPSGYFSLCTKNLAEYG